jgi:hypothetical protein
MSNGVLFLKAGGVFIKSPPAFKISWRAFQKRWRPFTQKASIFSPKGFGLFKSFSFLNRLDYFFAGRERAEARNYRGW